MLYKEKYKDFIYTAKEIQDNFEGSTVENDIITNCTVFAHLHFNSIHIAIRGKKHPDILPMVSCEKKLGHIVRFLVDLFEIKINSASEEAYLTDFINTPMRVIVQDDTVVAIGHFLNDTFVCVNSGNPISIWGIDK